MSKDASWSGGQRSKQYYGLREGYRWGMSHKTRDPADAMKQEWGYDLDVVTMLALDTQPIDRDWRRFAETREVVDLGRNERVAYRRLVRLNQEGADEETLQHRTSEEKVDFVKKGIKAAMVVDHGLMMGIINDGLFLAMCDTGMEGVIRQDFFRAMLTSVDLEADARALTEALEAVRESLYEKIVEDIGFHYWVSAQICSSIRRFATSDLLKKITVWLDELGDVREARELLRAREETDA